MVAIPGAGLWPARFVGRVLAVVWPVTHAERKPRAPRPQHPPRRERFVEEASMSREMYRL